mmetsp:Transcript_26655/g.57841  ORF Transcript_26655/g.57841 Transcript_26655/m.57841 type:complete len:564 (-) Transcript_26655:53-1744(-)
MSVDDDRSGDAHNEAADTPKHTIALRSALEDCENGLKELLGERICVQKQDGDPVLKRRVEEWAARILSSAREVAPTAVDVRPIAKSINQQRKDGLHDFMCEWNGPPQCPVDTVRIVDSRRSEHIPVPPIDSTVVDDNDSIPEHEVVSLSPLEFKRQYVYRNIPAIVRGLDCKGNCFHPITQLWRNVYKEDHEATDECTSERSINDDWFIENVGRDTTLQIRMPSQAETLDEEGRSEECETTDVTMEQWIDYCRGATSKGDHLYLKDWHLVQYLEMQAKEKVEKEKDGAYTCDRQSVDDSPLYSVPFIFGPDVLNSFLLRYFGGDFRFTYWGPQGSSTALHSDVLHTFSWSFNVVGEKEWIFYPPTFNLADNFSDIQYTGETISFSLTQREGDAVFVPSGWRHEVRNVRETISINHNWFTAASVDKVWECLLIESKAVEKEAGAWGIRDCSAKERMLRGCIGLDVTTFFLAVLSSLVDELRMLSLGCFSIEAPALATDCTTCIWERLFNIRRLSHQLHAVRIDCSLELIHRLSSGLMSVDLGQKCLLLEDAARCACEHIFNENT